jgi:hypothetical protein
MTIAAFCFSIGTLFGQTAPTASKGLMTYDQNQNWLASTKALDQRAQWTAIIQRFSHADLPSASNDSSKYAPLIVVNGVPLFTNDSGDGESKQIIEQLPDSALIREISILENPGDNWIFCKPFEGVILITADKKTGKRLRRLKSE